MTCAAPAARALRGAGQLPQRTGPGHGEVIRLGGALTCPEHHDNKALFSELDGTFGNDESAGSCQESLKDQC
jgi:hypothetical protein